MDTKFSFFVSLAQKHLKEFSSLSAQSILPLPEHFISPSVHISFHLFVFYHPSLPNKVVLSYLHLSENKLQASALIIS